MAVLKADNNMLAFGIVAAALIVVLIRPPNIDLSQSQTQTTQTPAAGGGGSSFDPLKMILGFFGI